MTHSNAGQADQAGDSDLTRTYALVLVIEALVILGLYWLGRHFA